MHWFSENYQWIFSGIGVLVLALLLKRLRRPSRSSASNSAALTAQSSTVTASPVASGSGISQTVNSPTVNLNIGNSASEAIHQRRVNALLAINSKLEEALFYLQRAASSSKFAGEASDQELLFRMGRSLAEASQQYSQNKLLINPNLTRRLDEFFSKMVSAGMILNSVMDPLVSNGQPRANLWMQVQETAYKEIPSVLGAIQTEIRAMI